MATGRRIAIIQSNYVPWKGYFDIINMVDEFVFLDDAQFTTRDWRNRNRVKTPQGLRWISIPVESKGHYSRAIDETLVAEPWVDRHLRTIEMSYARARCFGEVYPWLAGVYESVRSETHLSRINMRFVEAVCAFLGVRTALRTSREYGASGAKTDRLLSICRAAGASSYLSGPAAKDYLDVDRFSAAGIAVEFMDYGGYRAYTQLHGPFEHHVSIVDLLLHEGPGATSFMKSFG